MNSTHTRAWYEHCAPRSARLSAGRVCADGAGPGRCPRSGPQVTARACAYERPLRYINHNLSSSCHLAITSRPTPGLPLPIIPCVITSAQRAPAQRAALHPSDAASGSPPHRHPAWPSSSLGVHSSCGPVAPPPEPRSRLPEALSPRAQAPRPFAKTAPGFVSGQVSLYVCLEPVLVNNCFPKMQRHKKGRSAAFSHLNGTRPADSVTPSRYSSTPFSKPVAI